MVSNLKIIDNPTPNYRIKGGVFPLRSSINFGEDDSKSLDAHQFLDPFCRIGNFYEC
jgi:hypothetical protein